MAIGWPVLTQMREALVKLHEEELDTEYLLEASGAHEAGRECVCEAANAHSKSVTHRTRVAFTELKVDEVETGSFSTVGASTGVGDRLGRISTECL